MTVSQVQKFHTACGSVDPSRPTVPRPDSVELRIDLMREELNEVMDAIDDLCLNPYAPPEKFAALAKEIADLRYVVDGTVLVFGMADVIDEVCDRVHESNMSKFDPDTLEPYERRADGKIMKGPHYQPPLLNDLFGEGI